MSRDTNPGVGQGMFFVPEEIKAPDLPPDFDQDRVVTFSHMLRVISDYIDLPTDYTTEADVERVKPENIEPGLCFGTREARFMDLHNVYMGIGFSATQFLVVARSPRDLAEHATSRALSVNERRPAEERLDRDTARATAARAAGHELTKRIERLEGLRSQLARQRQDLLALDRESYSYGRAHWKVSNLDKLRKTASDIIHGHVEIAAINLGWDDSMASDLQKALRYNLYGRRGMSNTRIGFWREYLSMADAHTRRQIGAVSQSKRVTLRELEKYRPYLEAAKIEDDQTS